MVERTEERGASPGSRSIRGASAISLSRVRLDQEARLPVPIAEFSRVLGGGFVPGSLVLLGGEPGIGKSTMALELAALMARAGRKALYVSGEESAAQIKMRASRLGLDGAKLYLLTESHIEQIATQIDDLAPDLVVIDSIQTTTVDGQDSAPGLVAQVRASALQLRELAKATAASFLLIGHVTKDGNIAGPRVLEHIVDVVLLLEGDRFGGYRLLRGVKNRFGATSEVGVFEMRGDGLAEVPNPSEAFLEERLVNAPGSAIAVTMEGTRPLLVELQALASPTPFSNPRRTANGVDSNRLLLISAVLSKRLGLKLWGQDIFVNVVGGMRIQEPAADLAMAMAIASSYYERPLPADLAVAGEVGLSGELRRASQLAARLQEARKIGFKRALVPRLGRRGEPTAPGIDLIQARSLREAIDAVIPKA